MKAVVIGSTGATGKLIVKKLLALGHDVTAFARNPAAITETSEKLHVAEGDGRDSASLERAVRGQDAVLSAFGPRSLKSDDVQEVFMRNLVAAMTKEGVGRLVNLSAAGAGDSDRRVRELLHEVYEAALYAFEHRTEFGVRWQRLSEEVAARCRSRARSEFDLVRLRGESRKLLRSGAITSEQRERALNLAANELTDWLMAVEDALDELWRDTPVPTSNSLRRHLG
jgi:NAD(P)H-binding